MPTKNYFDHLVKKVGALETLFYCKDSDAREAISELNTALAGVEGALDYVWNVGQSPVLYVSKFNSRFQTINAAVAYARTYCSTSRRVMIIIGAGMYEEYIDLDNNPGIDFFGIGAVTIRSYVAWRLSTLRCSNTIRVYNISFENYYTPEPDESAGYGLHADPITGSQVYYNCNFYSDNNSAIGIGMASNGSASFLYCTFRGANGGIYAHNNVQTGSSGQWLTFRHCIIESHDNSKCIRIDDAATIQSAGATSVMGIRFYGCVGNTNSVLYRYGNPVQSLQYIPADSMTYNIFLASDSANNSLIALNPILQKQTMTITFMSRGDNEWWIPVPNAYKYTYTKVSFRYHDRSGSSWGSWSDVAVTRELKIEVAQPEAIHITIPGTNGLAAGARVFELVVTAVPRTSYNLPITINT